MTHGDCDVPRKWAADAGLARADGGRAAIPARPVLVSSGKGQRAARNDRATARAGLAGRLGQLAGETGHVGL